MTPLMSVALGWVAGVWLAAQWAAPAWMWPALALAGAMAAGLSARKPRWRLALAGALALTLGAWRYQAAQPAWDDPAFVAAHNGAEAVVLEGVIWEEPDVRDTRTLLRVRAEVLQLDPGGAPVAVHGLVLVTAPRFSEGRLAAAGAAEWRYGDRVRVAGALETPPEDQDFSYRDYLARLDVHSLLRQPQLTFLAERQGQPAYQLIFDGKAQALGALARLFPEPHAALLSGILLGVEAGLPSEIKTAFSRTGTSHIVAISGFNVAILVGLFMGLFSRLLRPNRAALVTILIIAGYTVLVGASASVVRAALMGSLGVVGQRLGRSGGGLNALAFAALVMTAANPMTVWDIGFQLSASATLGLVLYGDRFQNAFERWLAHWLPAERAKQGAELAGELFLITLAAQVTTLPILLYYFRQLSLITLIANMVILPVQPAVMILGGLALLAGLVWLPLGQLLAWATWPLTAYTLAFVQFFADIPGAAISLGEVAPAVVVIFYGALFIVTWALSRPPDERPKWWTTFAKESLPAGGASVLALGIVMAWGAAFSVPETPGQLRVTVLDTGPDPAVLIQTPAGRAVLVNGGSSGGALTRGLAQYLPLFQSKLDVLVLAGADEAALGGIPDVLARYQAERVVVTGAAGKGAAYAAVMTTLSQQGPAPQSAAGRPVFDLDDGITLRVLADGVHGSSLWLEWQAFSLALPLGVTKPAEADALAAANPAAATVLVLAEQHQAVAETLAEAWDPMIIAIATAPAGPAADTRALAGRTLLRTGERGALMVTTDGRQMWVEAGR